MKLRTDKWRHYLVAFTALVVVATGLAATPLRKSLTPFVTKPLGSWSLPVARSTGLATVPTAYRPASASVTTGSIVELGALGATPALPDFTIARNDSTGLIDLADVTEHSRHGAGASSGDGSSREQGGNGKSSRYGNSFRWGRSGGVGYAGGSAFSGSGSIARGSSGSRSGSGGGSGNGSAGSGGINDPGPIFNDHKSGFPELTGRKNGAVGAGGLAAGVGSTLASNPEPSTLILFGTGLITAVGTIRRRLRRQ